MFLHRCDTWWLTFFNLWLTYSLVIQGLFSERKTPEQVNYATSRSKEARENRYRHENKGQAELRMENARR